MVPVDHGGEVAKEAQGDVVQLQAVGADETIDSSALTQRDYLAGE
jgi:hypothetical protein